MTRNSIPECTFTPNIGNAIEVSLSFWGFSCSCESSSKIFFFFSHFGISMVNDVQMLQEINPSRLEESELERIERLADMVFF